MLHHDVRAEHLPWRQCLWKIKVSHPEGEGKGSLSLDRSIFSSNIDSRLAGEGSEAGGIRDPQGRAGWSLLWAESLMDYSAETSPSDSLHISRYRYLLQLRQHSAH